MSDLVPVHAINTILNWFLWAAIALGAGLVIVSLWFWKKKENCSKEFNLKASWMSC